MNESTDRPMASGAVLSGSILASTAGTIVSGAPKAGATAISAVDPAAGGPMAKAVEVVTQRTGMSAADAEQRVDAVIKQAEAAKTKAEQEAKAAADAARKVASGISLWMVISLLAGAFCASLAATFGGRTRDRLAKGARHEAQAADELS